MTIRVGIIMDPISKIKVVKDSSFAMMLEAQRRGWELLYMEQGDLYLRDGRTFAKYKTVTVEDDEAGWYSFGEQGEGPMDEIMDAVLMRKDPPFDMEYVYSTYMLERAEQSGVLVVNKPQSLRDANEKLYTAWFPQCCVPALVSRSMDDIRGFISEHKDVIVKPLGLMGGASIFRLGENDPNINVILETMTAMQTQYAMAQRFIPEISKEGDKRILIVDGVAVDYALARIPKQGETRGNLAAGGRAEGVPLTERDRWIVEQLAPTLIEKGLIFVGIDVIGDYLTEVNVTSPTCIRELDTLYGLNIAGMLMDAIEKRLF